MPVTWSGNAEGDPQFMGNSINQPLDHFQLSSGSPARTANGFTLEPIPANWPGASDLNASRTNAGALEYGTVGIQSLIEQGMRVYPNPTTGSVMIQFANTEQKRIRIFNTVGALERESLSTGSAVHLNLSELSIGVYFIQVDSKSDRFTSTLIID